MSSETKNILALRGKKDKWKQTKIIPLLCLKDMLSLKLWPKSGSSFPFCDCCIILQKQGLHNCQDVIFPSRWLINDNFTPYQPLKSENTIKSGENKYEDPK